MYVPKEISLDSYHAPPSTDNYITKPSYMDRPVPVPTTFRNNNNPWLQTNGNGQSALPQTVPQNQTHFKVSSAISSPWHEMERKTPKTPPGTSSPNVFGQSPTWGPSNFKKVNCQPQYQSPQPTQQTQYRSQPPPFKKPNSDIYNQNFNTAARGRFFFRQSSLL